MCVCGFCVVYVPFWKPAGNCTGPLFTSKPTVYTSRPVSILTESTIFSFSLTISLLRFFFRFYFPYLTFFFLTGALVYNRRLFGLMRFPVAHAHGIAG